MVALFARMMRDFRTCWTSLFLTDGVYKILAFILLTPLTAVLFQALLRLSGRPVMADQDLLFFVAAPVGWLCLIVIGAAWLTVVALEMAALLAILLAADEFGKKVAVRSALVYAAAHAPQVLRVTARMIVWVLVMLAPALVIAAVVYWGLLNDYDINFYLKEKPPEFMAAIVIAGILICVLILVALRLASNWFFALPLVLFEAVPASQALRASSARSEGHRKTILLCLVLWSIGSLLVTGLLSSAVVAFGRWVLPSVEGSLGLLIFVIGVLLSLWFVAGLVGNLLSTTVFATMLMALYRQLACEVDLAENKLVESSQDARPPLLRLSRIHLVIAGGVAAVLAAVVGIIAVQAVSLQDDVEIIAHRGASSVAPENTLAAIRQAIEEEADWVEIDVQETADDEVVVLHDSDFMKLAGNKLKIWNATRDDLQQIDIGSWFAAEFSEERVPSLADVLALCKDKVNVNIELKYYGHDKQLEQRVIEVVESQGMADQVVYMSLKQEGIQKVKAMRPACRVGLLMSVSAGRLADIEADFLAVNASFIDFWFIRAAHSQGKDVYAWTVNDPLLMSSMISLGVDGLITDKPGLARQVLKERESLGPATRVLLQMASVFGVSRPVSEQ
ncbi:MAG: glycerophosphodiester phosphodiesterase [bacterium]|nr:glycerophosphodiester phosphodiesterase [bacterium]